MGGVSQPLKNQLVVDQFFAEFSLERLSSALCFFFYYVIKNT